jgi:hypothetical protein
MLIKIDVNIDYMVYEADHLFAALGALRWRSSWIINGTLWVVIPALRILAMDSMAARQMSVNAGGTSFTMREVFALKKHILKKVSLIPLESLQASTDVDMHKLGSGSWGSTCTFPLLDCFVD